MLLDILLPLIGGGLLLALGGEALVSGSVAVARRLSLSPVLIGVFLIGFGTSMPELLTSLDAALAGSPAIALGNVLGSNTANVLLIGGVAGLLAPMALDREALRFDLWVAVAAAVFLGLAVAGTGLSTMTGALFVLFLMVYALVAVTSGLSAMPTGGAEVQAVPIVTPDAAHPHLLASLALAGAGMAAAIFGADIFVGGAVAAARAFGISEAVIGATIVAIGTSLPELATSVMAARRGEAALAITNIIGSNIFNILGVLGAALLVAPIEPPAEALWRDLPAMLAATLVLVLVVLLRGGVTRPVAGLMVAAYAGYLALML